MELAPFWEMTSAQRRTVLWEAITDAHTYHFARNRAYRTTVTARGVGELIAPELLPRLLRPTAQTFKSYSDRLSTAFPYECPAAFLEWMADQLSIDLPLDRSREFRSRYGSLESFLLDFERIYVDFGLEVLTSSGTSGRATIMVRDQAGLDQTTESFYLCFQRYLKMHADHRAIFFMPAHTRIAMARMANFSVRRIGVRDDHIHFTIPFPAHPDQVRIRAGRTFHANTRGLVERRILHPFMRWMNDQYVTPSAVAKTIKLMAAAETAGEKVLLFGGLVQLHAVALELLRLQRPLRLAAGSLIGTGGGLKEQYPWSPDQIRADLSQAITLTGAEPIPIRDVYGMAEGNWAAMQCAHGNYHIPPWVLAVIVDSNDRVRDEADATGLLAFYDPCGGGNLFPAFFKTADQVRLIQGDVHDFRCPCDEAGAYLMRDSIRRVDLLDEAGCAAQV